MIASTSHLLCVSIHLHLLLSFIFSTFDLQSAKARYTNTHTITHSYTHIYICKYLHTGDQKHKYAAIYVCIYKTKNKNSD